MKLIIIGLILSTLTGLLSNIVATWIEPKLSKYRKLTIFIFICLTVFGLFYSYIISENDKEYNSVEINENENKVPSKVDTMGANRNNANLTLELSKVPINKIRIDTPSKVNQLKPYFDENLALICRSGDSNCNDIWYSANCGDSHLLLDNQGRCIYYSECTHLDLSIFIGQYSIIDMGREGTEIACTFKYKCLGIAYLDPNAQSYGEPEIRNFTYSKIKDQTVKIRRNECRDTEYKESYQFYLDNVPMYDGPMKETLLGQVGQVVKYQKEVKTLKNYGYYNKISKLIEELKL
jgi:hypothetical protein